MPHHTASGADVTKPLLMLQTALMQNLDCFFVFLSGRAHALWQQLSEGTATTAAI